VILRTIAVLLLLAAASSSAEKPQRTSLTLRCQFKVMSHHWGDQYTCIGRDVVVGSYDTYVIGISGVHLDGKTDKDVEAIYFEGQRTVFIPFGLSTWFPNLRTLNIQESGLTYLNRTTFRDYENLRYIHLDRNTIEYVDRKAFRYLTELEGLSLAANRIRYLDSDMLRGLTNLKYFSVGRNEIEVIPSGLFQDNVNLEQIFFYGNRIRMIGENLVRPTRGLKIAGFEGNICTDIFFNEGSGIVEKLTTEFRANCGVNCIKAKTAAITEIENLVRENLRLNEKVMSNKVEKQSLRLNCD
jgi:Leucine-rich repeat (LRR) protein